MIFQSHRLPWDIKGKHIIRTPSPFDPFPRKILALEQTAAGQSAQKVFPNLFLAFPIPKSRPNQTPSTAIHQAYTATSPETLNRLYPCPPHTSCQSRRPGTSS